MFAGLVPLRATLPKAVSIFGLMLGGPRQSGYLSFFFSRIEPWLPRKHRTWPWELVARFLLWWFTRSRVHLAFFAGLSHSKFPWAYTQKIIFDDPSFAAKSSENRLRMFLKLPPYFVQQWYPQRRESRSCIWLLLKRKVSCSAFLISISSLSGGGIPKEP